MTTRRGTAVTGARRRRRHRLTATVGQTFGSWTVVQAASPDAIGGKARVLARCACGIERVLRLGHLLSGDSRSCGWRHLMGERVGALRVLRPAAHESGRPAWLCACDCGRQIVLTTARLTHSTSPTTHCGCRTMHPAADETADLQTPPVEATPVRVRAVRLGYYQHLRRRVGDVFTLTNPAHFSPIWMQPVAVTEPERVTGAQAALDLAADSLRPFTVVRRPDPTEEPEGVVLHDVDPLFRMEEDT